MRTTALVASSTLDERSAVYFTMNWSSFFNDEDRAMKQQEIPCTRMGLLTPTQQLHEAWAVSGLRGRVTLLKAMRSPILSKCLRLTAESLRRAEERPND